MPTTHNFDKILRRYRTLQNRLPEIIGVEGVAFALDNFRAQGFVDGATFPWKKRRRGAPRNSGRAILIDKGRLVRSVRVTKTTATQAWIGSDLPYAAIHNEGGQVTGTASVRQHTRRRGRSTHSVSAHTRKVNFRMPRRRFIGPSVTLSARINRKIKLELLKVFKT